MSSVLIIEDEKEIRQDLSRIIKNIDSTIILQESDTIEGAYNIAMNKRIDMFLIDVCLEHNGDGIALAKRIRKLKQYLMTPIIFVTGNVSRELEAYRNIGCYRYIIKPYKQEEIENLVLNILDNINIENEKLILKFKGINRMVNYNEIRYVELKSRKILIAKQSEIIEYQRYSIKKFSEKFPKQFVQIHQAYVVNLEYIESIDWKNQSIKIIGCEQELQIGRSYMSAVRRLWNDYI